jgi:hypothetical protein
MGSRTSLNRAMESATAAYSALIEQKLSFVVSSVNSWPYGTGGEGHSAAQAARSEFITSTKSCSLPW